MMHTVCTISRPQSPTKDSSGGKADGSYTDLIVDEPCDLQPVRSDVEMKYRQMHLDVTHSCYVTRDVSARQTDKVSCDSRTFIVVGYEPPAVGYTKWPGVMHLKEEPSIT